MIKINFSGRSGNILLQNVGASILSKKFNLKCEYKNIEKFEILGLNLFQGEIINTQMINQYDIFHSHVEMGPYGDLMNLLSMNSIDYGLYYDGNFQVREFVKKYRNEIVNHFDLKYDNSKTNDLFIHIRLGDVSHLNPGINYYRKCINMLKYDKIFLSTDSPEHETIKSLVNEYNITLYNNSNEMEVINFAKDFGNLILSKGTFSWWIGILSNANKIFYPIGDTPWYGDIFVYDDWTPVNIK